MGTHMPYAITQCYMPPGTGNTLPQPITAGTQFSNPEGNLD